MMLQAERGNNRKAAPTPHHSHFCPPNLLLCGLTLKRPRAFLTFLLMTTSGTYTPSGTTSLLNMPSGVLKTAMSSSVSWSC